jgi:hypothetical protein
MENRLVSTLLRVAGSTVFAVGVVSGAPSIASAEETPDAEPVPVSIWYRNAEGCPDGATFVEELGRRGTRGKLAAVGDAVDFVVTLGSSGEQSAGRLERQTSRGTIAIRELSAPSCADVAQALALSLSVAARTSGEGAPAATNDGDATLANTAAGAAPRSEPANGAPAVPSTGTRTDSGAGAGSGSSRASHSRWTLGAQALIATGIAPEAAYGFDAYGSYDPAAPRPLAPTLRLTLSGLRAASETEVGDFVVSLATGRAEACPLALESGLFRFEPCAALELGAAMTEGNGVGGERTTHFWSAALALLRGRWLAGAFVIEAQAAAAVPFQRYRLAFTGPAGDEPAYTTAAVGFQAGLGAGFRLP